MKGFQRRFFTFVFLIGGLFLCGKFFSVEPRAIDEALSRIPLIWSSLAFIAAYIIGTFILWQLKDPLKIVGAVLFGAYLSTFFIYISEIINASIFFALSKKLGKKWVENSLKGRPKRFYENIGNMSLGWIFMLRSIPLIPYRVLDLSFGLSKISLKKYMVVVLLASPLRIFWIQFILASVKSLSFEEMTVYFLQNRPIFLWSLFYFIFAIIIAVKIQKKLKA